ncbi:predicted protein [Uncinocarpus reesii 1704]|uniref:Uncharacterized protein n=1 Tax=Uncinocarpus reesii (strain UAMH 1704) TaxID=336963 RepID=C4JR60_UNCRE|nr:uncharacterized protein UREG_03542 [Uncinocarpus reesii 1704]EEP78696.1 predicted protein [Uncinocarpus reesii 1704]
MEASSMRFKYEEVFVGDGAQDQNIRLNEHRVECGNRRTALSQHRNLYFVAFLHQIYVYQPTVFSVGTTPKLILTPTLKNPAAGGCISPSRPHALNNIVVGDLGNDEILLLATDSGNVSAYRTEHIFSAIEQSADSKRQKPEHLGANVPCFFSDWVRESAWGLAIHKLARLIAVSANTEEITVWAFALIDSPPNGRKAPHPYQHSYLNDWSNITTDEQFERLRNIAPHHRRCCNLRLTLQGHQNNIPCISFLNSELDPHGELLLSTDISNRVFGWRIWESRTPAVGWNLNPVLRNRDHDYIADSYDRGWGVLALDPRMFRKKLSVAEACGGQPVWIDDCSAYDLTSLVDRVPRASTIYTVLPQMHHNAPQHPSSANTASVEFGGSDEEGNFGGYVDLEQVPDGNETDGPNENEVSAATNQPNGEHSQALVPFQTSPDPPGVGSNTEASFAPEHAGTEVQGLYGPGDLGHDESLGETETEDQPMEDDDDDPSFLVDALLESLYGPTDTSSQYADAFPEMSIYAAVNPNASGIPYPEFPILHFSEADIRMILSPYSERGSVICRMALRQVFQTLGDL